MKSFLWDASIIVTYSIKYGSFNQSLKKNILLKMKSFLWDASIIGQSVTNSIKYGSFNQSLDDVYKLESFRGD